jgi:molybdenum cofactor guanylyltransferase
MGSPKATAELAGRPMVSRVVAAVGSAGLEPIVVAKPDSPLPRLDCRVLSEPAEPNHPLTGLVTALRASAGRGVVAVACDMPLVPAKVLGWLAEFEEDAVVCSLDGRLEPLLGRYSPFVLERLEAALEVGAPMRDTIADLDPFVIDEAALSRFADPRRILFNVNSPEDLIAAEDLLAGRERRFSIRRRRFAEALHRAHD